jgi:hypothetical protein
MRLNRNLPVESLFMKIINHLKQAGEFSHWKFPASLLYFHIGNSDHVENRRTVIHFKMQAAGDALLISVWRTIRLTVFMIQSSHDLMH